jgi:phosphoribosylformylglycinamidine synthase
VVKSAHDCSEGGIGIALAECCIGGNIGAEVALDDDLAPEVSLFSETQARILVTVAEPDADAFVASLVAAQVPYSVIGTVGGDRLLVEDKIDLPVAQLVAAYIPTLERLVHGEDTVQSEELREG